MSVIGRRFGEYQVLREIGRGVVAKVFLASDGRDLKALKLFAPEYRARAERELVYGSGLSHPNLNRIESTVELAGRPGLIMPYVPGLRLSQRAVAGEDDEIVLAAVDGLLRALGHLHGLGIVHRDVKPENILVDRSGHAVLVDYDLATGHPGRGDAVSPAGTVAFLSPEQARGEPATGASDLYAAGVVLLWGLTGRVPFTGTVEQVVRAHSLRRPRVAARLRPELQRFTPLLERLLAKRPEGRFGGALEAAEELERVRRGV